MGKDSPEPAKSGFAALPWWLQSQGRDISTNIGQDFAAGPQEFFPGQTFAGLDPLQQEGLGLQEQFARQGLPGQLGQIQSSFGQALNAGDIFSDPSVQAGLGTIESRGNQNFLENVLPGLRRGATGAGQEFGTRGELAAGVAGSRLQRDIGDAQAQFLANQLGSARQLQGAGLSLAPQQAALGFMPGQALGDVGQAFQQQDAAQIAEDMQRFNFGQQAADLNLDQMVSRFGGLTGMGSSIGATPGGTSPAAGALGGGIAGAQLGSMIPGFGAGAGTGIAGLLGPAGVGLGLTGAILGGLLS